eukprot:TRINITY_DN25730_c0_g2_i1.p1 TRINITY_DN25730_c0_g2~~TRINITY_DN25730_c0_g2_i1.p1  ORF type:complete len:161 (-),score=43.04 TRINITY_DN25730_c0_g2_i1:125-607(-)
MSLGLLCEQYGIHTNKEKAIKIGTKVAARLAAMGGKWIWSHPFSDEMDFLRLRRVFRQVFTEKRALCEEQFQKSSRQQGPKEECIVAGGKLASASFGSKDPLAEKRARVAGAGADHVRASGGPATPKSIKGNNNENETAPTKQTTNYEKLLAEAGKVKVL